MNIKANFSQNVYIIILKSLKLKHFGNLSKTGIFMLAHCFKQKNDNLQEAKNRKEEEKEETK